MGSASCPMGVTVSATPRRITVDVARDEANITSYEIHWSRKGCKKGKFSSESFSFGSLIVDLEKSSKGVYDLSEAKVAPEGARYVVAVPKHEKLGRSDYCKEAPLDALKTEL